MADALELALQNAAYNSPKDSPVHLENIESIIDPTQDEPKSTLSEAQLNQLKQDSEQYWANRPTVAPEAPQYNPRDVSFKSHYYPEGEPLKLTLDSIDYKLGEITNVVMYLNTKVDNISTTITTAAQSMPQESNHKHRSLHEWDDQYLVNELVERENDLMPFYYELLKRIGSPELQKLVMSSMQGKNASMVTLAQLCSALAPQPIPQQQPAPQQKVDVNAELARIAAMNADERQMFVDKMNQSPFTPYQTIPVQSQHFGQANEEYIKSLYTDKPVQNRIG